MCVCVFWSDNTMWSGGWKDARSGKVTWDGTLVRESWKEWRKGSWIRSRVLWRDLAFSWPCVNCSRPYCSSEKDRVTPQSPGAGAVGWGCRTKWHSERSCEQYLQGPVHFACWWGPCLAWDCPHWPAKDFEQTQAEDPSILECFVPQLKRTDTLRVEWRVVHWEVKILYGINLYFQMKGHLWNN